jgi:N-dimethylarginine dimethylaminohydrolase
VTHAEREEVDAELAGRQWEAYVEALHTHGWETLEAQVLLLGGGRLLLAASAPKTAELLAGLGFEPVVVDISEFEKLEGFVTCLSVRLRELCA